MDENADLLAALTKTVDGLLYLSESEAPLTPFVWPDVRSEKIEEAVVAGAKLPPTTPLEVTSLDDFFESTQPDYPDPPAEEVEAARRFRDLRALLEKSLEGPAAVRVGDKPDKPVYVLGRTKKNIWAGVSTRVTET